MNPRRWPLLLAALFALSAAGCGDVLEGVGDVSRDFVHGDTTTTFGSTTLPPPGVESPRLGPEKVTHVSSQLVFDVQTGTLDVATAAAFGLWTASPYTVPRTEGQLVGLRVGP